MSPSSFLRGAGFAAISYFVLSLVFLAPVSLDPAHRIAYIGDSISFIYFPIENVSRAFRDPANLLNAPVAFPHASAALFEAHRLGFGLLMAPLSALSGSPVLAANTATTLVYIANGLSARWMSLVLGATPLGAWFAGGLFAFHTYAANEQPRPHVLFEAFLPLALVSLVRLLEGGSKRQAWLVGAALVAQALFETYVAVFGVVLLTATYFLFLAARPSSTLSRTRSLVAPALLSALLISPLAIAYLSMSRSYDYSREPPPSMDLAHYVATSETNVLYGAMGPSVRRQQMGPHFVGFVTLLLVVIAVATRRRTGESNMDGEIPGRRWIPGAFGLMIFFMSLSLGRSISVGSVTLGPGPYGLLYDHLALFRATRIPERYGILAMLFAAVLAGRALSVLRWPKTLLAAIAAFGLFEHLSPMPTYDTLPSTRDYPPVYAWLKGRPDVRAVAEVPIHGEGLVRYESLDMYYGLLHHKPVISGYLSFEPLLTRILRQVAADAPDPSALEVLREAGVDTLVVHEGRGFGRETLARAREATGRGDLELLAEFEPKQGAIEPGRDAVFRISRPDVLKAPNAKRAAPTGRRLLDPTWRYVSNIGDPTLVGDSNEQTQWSTNRPVVPGDFIQINFRDRAFSISSVVLPMTRKEFLPTDFALDGRVESGDWVELARYRPAARLGLVQGLLESPGRAAVRFDLSGSALTGVRLRALPGASSFDGWRLSEIELHGNDSQGPR